MATIVSDELRRRLMDKGLWGDFVRRRQDIVENEGLNNYEAAKTVLGEMDPEALPLIRGRGRPKKVAGKLPVPPPPHVPPKPSQTLADVRRANRDAKSNALQSSQLSPSDLEVTKETFAGKSCAYSVSLNWAYSNYRIADIRPSDAPSAVAWNLLLDIRESPSFKADVLKGWSNAMARKAEADEQKDRFDGEGEYDLLAALAKGGGE